MNGNLLRALGFGLMDWREAQKKWPGVSTDGDDVWVHGEIWFQGELSGTQIFSAIFNAGKHRGHLERIKMIHDALDLTDF